jgi:hypothetical protein
MAQGKGEDREDLSLLPEYLRSGISIAAHEREVLDRRDFTVILLVSIARVLKRKRGILCRDP